MYVMLDWNFRIQALAERKFIFLPKLPSSPHCALNSFNRSEIWLQKRLSQMTVELPKDRGYF